MPETGPLDWLMQRLTRLIQTATDALERQYPSGVDAWEQEVSRQLARYHAAAMLAGADAATLTEAMHTVITRTLAVQLAFLKQFGIAIRDGAAWERSWNARAAMYAQSIKVPYWQGRTKMLPLPAMPAEGTQCLTHCKCAWEVSPVDEEAGDYDAYWRRGADDSCQTCRQRELEWAPVRIRGGVLQI